MPIDTIIAKITTREDPTKNTAFSNELKNSIQNSHFEDIPPPKNNYNQDENGIPLGATTATGVIIGGVIGGLATKSPIGAFIGAGIGAFLGGQNDREIILDLKDENK